MARRPRIEIAGYYHIINRGVGQIYIFKEPDDYEYFEELMCFYMNSYGITLHNYCLMGNHYHLLIEITQENLSKFMRQLNMNYAIYFNKKYKRVGHLWQGRFKSWYVTDEAYLYTLMLYIEQNPLKSQMVKALREYPYSSYHYFLEKNIPECLQKSWIVEQYQGDTEAIEVFLNAAINTAQLQAMRKASSLVEAPNVDNTPDSETLKNYFKEAKETKERNIIICKAYKEGYSQHMIAKVLGLAQSTVSAIVKRGNDTTITP